MNTKSLNECINDVMNEKSSRTEKRTKLIKLGLCEHEIKMLIASVSTPSASKGGFSFSKLTFGVEIECYNVIREMLIEASTANGLQVRSEGYNHNDSRKYYKIVSDSSIQGNNTNEVVSPILKGKRGLSSLKAICDSLATIDARVNKSCGLHIHIGASSLSDEHYSKACT